MSDEEQDASFQRVTDPARLRALAHPLRIQLLDVLTERGEATATECAEIVGESAASCSFHLRMLEKYGFIERAETRGRERPWRPVARSWDMRPDPDSPGSLRALQEVALLALDAEWERTREFFSQTSGETDEWIQASILTRATFWATAEELAQLSRDLQTITDRFAGRSADPSKRPPGARFSRMVAIANPEPWSSPFAGEKPAETSEEAGR
ncbi:ArsR/SmtB family transcription factor [Microbacterium sp. ASV49]|uniref:Helix-turn-helix domain-containing protein n=1 Tax=Microbacterium candidum TaxID=3041922 RepID=A0ABT7N3J3_9MICO|nr:helix-turn-helix domain-containing protein [Microbacterium sp. ASV49]MDL9981240.1 helix-turn-helix domain-containing protein [Microbacterium sp. ASV49]